MISSSSLRRGLEESLHVTDRHFFFPGEAFAAEIPADPPIPVFLCLLAAAFTYLPQRDSLGSIRMKARVGERGSAGFNYQLSKSVVLCVCAGVCPVTEASKK